MHKITGRALPTVAAIQAEAARVEAMIAASAQRMESSSDPRAALHLQVCRAELHAYLAGLLYSLGQTDLLERQAVASETSLSDVEVVNYQDVPEEESLRMVECFEC